MHEIMGLAVFETEVVVYRGEKSKHKKRRVCRSFTMRRGKELYRE